jgi:hypothetical protein
LEECLNLVGLKDFTVSKIIFKKVEKDTRKTEDSQLTLAYNV